MLGAVLNQEWLTKVSDRSGVDNYSVSSIQQHIEHLQTCIASVNTSVAIGFDGFEKELELAAGILQKLIVLRALAQVI